MHAYVAQGAGFLHAPVFWFQFLKVLPVRRARTMEAMRHSALTTLLKKHFSALSPETQEFQALLLQSLDEVVIAYEDFFKSVARQGSKLNKADVVKSLSSISSGDQSQLQLLLQGTVRTRQSS